MNEDFARQDNDMVMKKTKREAIWLDARHINNNLARKRSDEKMRQVSIEKDEDKKRLAMDMKKARETIEFENKVNLNKK